MKKTMMKRQTSGQALIITSLVIAMLLLSTTYYVFEIKRSASREEATTDFALNMIKQATINTMISALANFTNGGGQSVLAIDLSRLSSNIEDHFYKGQCLIQFTPLNASPYRDGTWISWEDNGSGISSADASSTVNFSDSTATYYSEFETILTTRLLLESAYLTNGTEKNVNVTCTLYNENEPALANDIVITYQNETDGPWITVDSSNNPDTVDYGNGTYLLSFNVDMQSFLRVSANVHDMRDILVIANTTSMEV